MKTIIFATLFFFAGLTAYADSLDRLANKYKNEKEAVYVGSLKAAILMHAILDEGDFSNIDIKVNGREFDDDVANEIMETVVTALGITSFRMLVLDDCSSDVKRAFKKSLSKAIPNEYELFLKQDENSIYLKEDGKKYRILITAASDDSAFFIEATSNNDFLISMLKEKTAGED